MPYKPNLAGSWGRSHSDGRLHQPKGIVFKAREDEKALAKFMRTDHGAQTRANSSENPNSLPVIQNHGHRSRPVAYPRSPSPRHARHEAHKPERTALSATLPTLAPRMTATFNGQMADPQITESFDPKKHNWSAQLRGASQRCSESPLVSGFSCW
jgi:hypothetical protein